MRLDRLEVQDFLGIRGTVALDLDADLVVIQAPNGTGKSSLCAALEWGLTSRVRRLGIVQSKDQAQVASRFAEAPDPRVRVHLTVPGGSLAMERRPGKLSWTDGSDAPRPTTDKAIFARLAPEAALDGLPTPVANRWRADWIHGTRFLSGEEMAVLLEEDADAPDRGRTVVARLFGVSELDRQERLLEAFLAEPPSLRSLDRQLEEALTEEEDARGALEEHRARGEQQARALREVLLRVDHTLQSVEAEYAARTNEPAPDGDRLEAVRGARGDLARAADTLARDPVVALLEAQVKDRRERRRTLERRIRHWRVVDGAAREALQATRALKLARIQAQLDPIQQAVSAIFRRAQVNAVFDEIQATPSPERGSLTWRAMAGVHVEGFETRSLSLGQRQDLALAIFLARARTLGGTFVLDEPLAHLDDLNKVALLDTLRVLATEAGSRVHLVITTASRRLTRHLVQKFHGVPSRDGRPTLAVYELTGNTRLGAGVRREVVSAP